MAKKKEYSFSDEAKAIMKRFPRRETDPIEKRDYEEAMTALQQEQEMMRESMGLGEPDTMAYGGMKKYDLGGYNPMVMNSIRQQMQNSINSSLIPQTFIDFQNSKVSPIANNIAPLEMSTTPQPTLEISKLQDWGKQQQIKAATMPDNQTSVGRFLTNNKEYLPSLISGASNIGSNLLLAALSKNNKANLTPAMGVSERINLEPQAEQLRRDATVAKNVASRNARNLGVNSGQALANMGAIGADVDRNLGANLTNLYMGQEGTNVGAANQFNMANVQAVNQAGMFNEQSRLQNNSNRLDYLAGALGTVPGVMKDINLQNADAATRKMYENYIKSLGRNYFYSGDLFGSVPMNYGVRQ